MSAETLLARLTGVKQTGPDRWLAKCPAHDDRSPSLSIRALPDGRVLAYCFGGCHVEDVLTATGLTLSDLFPEGVRGHHVRPTRSGIPASDLLLVIHEDVLAVGIIGAQLLEKQTISESDWSALAAAVARIGRAADEVRR